jgi:hypothetical protein
MKLRPAPLALSILLMVPVAASATSVPVSRCPTTYGVKQAPPPIPSTVSVSLGTLSAGSLAGYANGAITLLAPRGWVCSGEIGADGSGGMMIHPRGAGSDGPEISALSADTPGVAADLACPFFAAAVAQLPVKPCPERPPAAERRSTVSPHLVSFVDPPGVHGSGVPSGGAYAASGIVTFFPSTKRATGYAGKATCTLPSSEQAVCTVALSVFLTHPPQ